MTLEIILLLVVVKLPIIAWLLWMPFRGGRGEAADDFEPDEGSGDDGGGGGGPRRRPPHERPPLPRLSRRGPHGGRTAPPARVRSVVGRPMPVRSARP